MKSQAILVRFMALAATCMAAALPVETECSDASKDQRGPPPPGLLRGCQKWAKPMEGDNCETMASRYSVTVKEFEVMNPSLKGQSTLDVVKTYCVKIVVVRPPGSNGEEGAGMNGSESVAESSNYSGTAAAASESTGSVEGYTTATAAESAETTECCLGASETAGSNYATDAASATTEYPGTATETETIATPSPTQPGMVADCRKFYKVQANETCYDVMNQNQPLCFESLLAWNPSIGGNCTDLQADAFVCVLAPPPAVDMQMVENAPKQPGIVENCETFFFVQQGMNCRDVMKAHANVSMCDLEAMNPSIGSDCKGLLAGVNVCVAKKESPEESGQTYYRG